VIANYLSKQSAQTIALVCSKLSTSKTGEILPLFDEEVRKSVFARILSMHNVAPTTMTLLERNLSSAFLSASGGSDSSEAPVRLAGILNEVDRADADRYLSEISQSVGEAKAAAVKLHLFRFEDIPKLDPAARTTIFDGMSVDLIVMALRGAEPDLRETIMSAVGQRSRRMIESELGNEVTVRADDIKSAQRSIVSTIMKLAHEGRIEMHAEEEKEAA
jgi:flagellar motor switch protein FliG